MNPELVRDIARDLQLLCSPTTDVRFHGTSMEPLLRENDRVVVQPVEREQIKIGDIITYRDRDLYPTRRVVKVRQEEIELWCENWPNRRFRTRMSDVLGRAVARIRDGQRLSESDGAWRRQRARALRTYNALHGRSRLRNLVGKVRRRLKHLTASR